MHEFILIATYIVILLYSIIIHEVSHGVMALWLGDRTAQYAGRLNLDPRHHIDPWGSIAVPLMLLIVSSFQMAFGWAKPVPYNPYNLRNQKWGPLWVALSGPGINIALALVATILAKIVAVPILVKTNMQNMIVGGEWSALADIVAGSPMAIVYAFLLMVVFWNVVLAFFNLIPIPPLDGSKILYAIFPFSQQTQIFLEQYGLVFLLFAIIFFSGPIQWVLTSALGLFFGLAI